MNLTIHVNVICCSFCRHNGLDIDPNGGAVAAISFNRSGRTECRSEISKTSDGMTARNRAVLFCFFFFSIRGDLGIPHSLFCSRISHRIHDFKHETNRSQKACEFLWGKGAHKKKEICRLNYENSKMHTFSFFSSCWWKLS